MVETPLVAKADVDAGPADRDGRTALQAAAGGGHLDVVERLLAAKADVNAAPARYERGRN
jgi:ankyrin repeat protein